MTKPPSQWRGAAGGAPILSQPIARVGQYPLSTYKPCAICKIVARWRCFFVALAILIIVPLIAVLIGG